MFFDIEPRVFQDYQHIDFPDLRASMYWNYRFDISTVRLEIFKT